VIQSNITITLNFSRFMVQDLDSFFLFLSLVEILTVSLGPKALGYCNVVIRFYPQRKFQTACLVSFMIILEERHDRWLNDLITPFPFFPPFALFLAPQN
jgi:hypothetical protein